MESSESMVAATPAKRGGKGTLIGMIIFMLISIGLGVWLAILLINNNGSSKNSSTKSGDSSKIAEIDNPSGDQMAIDAKNGYVVSSKVSNMYLTKGGDVYVATNDWKNNTLGGPYKLETSSNAGSSGSYTFKPGDDFDSYSILSNSDTLTIKGMKLNIENVASIFAIEYGQNWAGDNYAIVKNDGALEIVSLHYKNESTLNVSINKIDSISDVIAVVNTNIGEAMGVSAVKKDGSIVGINSELSNLSEKLVK